VAQPTAQHSAVAQLLAELGRDFGYDSRAADDSVAWARPGALGVAFTFGAAHIDVALTRPDGAVPWGRLAYDRVASLRGTPMSSAVCPTHNRRCLRLKVLANTRVCPDHYLLRLALPADLDVCLAPGQFFHLACDGLVDDSPLALPLTLRRPISIHTISYAGFDRALLARAAEFPAALRDAIDRRPAEVTFLYKVVGRGTQLLTAVQPGQQIDAIGPCGNGFAPGPERHAILVAGGIGAAPLVALAEALRARDVAVHLYLGAMKSEYLVPALCRPDHTLPRRPAPGTPEFRGLITDEFRQIGATDVHICTDDGSEGEKGFVTGILERHLQAGILPDADVCVYACGPHGMLKSAVKIVARHGMDCRVLLEERMACGIGACAACTCTTQGPAGREKKRVCKDGPVFDASEIVWES
jgi:dihydroorotate dehydrogenase electron transfer subunit